jgi:hypothetical protein
MELKAILIGVAVLALACGGYWAYLHAYDSGKTAGAAEVQTKWDADQAAIAAQAAAAAAQAAKDKDAADANNARIQDDLQAQLLAARSSAATYASELQNTRARLAASLRAVPKAANNAGSVAGAAASSVGQLDAATGAALAECAVVRSDYHALIAELSPQL